MKIVEQVEAIVHIDEGVNHAAITVKLNKDVCALQLVYNNHEGSLVAKKSELIAAFRSIIDWMESKP